MKLKQKEQVEELGKLNELKIIKTIKGKRTRVQLDFSNCVSRTDVSQAQATDINYLVKRYTPDELTSYITARNMYRQEIKEHDFSKEPNLQQAMNEVVEIKRIYNELDPSLKNQFVNHIEFIKFVNNPQNTEKLLKLGLMTKKEIETVTQTKTEKTQTQETQKQQET